MNTVNSRMADDLEALAIQVRACADEEQLREEARTWLTRHCMEFYILPVTESYPVPERAGLLHDLEAVRQYLLLKVDQRAPESLLILVESEHLLPTLEAFEEEGPFARVSKNCHTFLSALIEEVISEVRG